MKTNNPTRGLLMYSFYSARGNIGVAILVALAMGVALLITGNTVVYTFFVSVAIGIPPYLIMMKMGAPNQLQWEKYQVSMPVKRKNMVAAFYLSILLAAIFGLLLCVVILGVGFILHESIAEVIIETAFSQLSYILGLALLMGGLLLPIGSTKVAENRGEAFFSICLGLAIGITWIISWVGIRAGISPVIMSLSRVIISAIVFIISYYIVSNMYSKNDF